MYQLLTLMFLMHGFWAGRRSSILGAWTAPAAGETLRNGEALRAPPFGRVFPGAGGTQTPKPSISGRSKNRVSKTLRSAVNPACEANELGLLQSGFADSREGHPRGEPPDVGSQTYYVVQAAPPGPKTHRTRWGAPHFPVGRLNTNNRRFTGLGEFIDFPA